MSIILFITWLLLTIGVAAMALHTIGREYGDFVALSTSTRVSVFIAAGTVIGIIIGAVRWLVL